MGTRRRIAVLLALFVFSAFAIMARLFYWQFVKAEELRALASGQQETTQVIPAFRGKIVSSDGFTLVDNIKAYLLYADLTKINKDKIYEISQKLTPFMLDDKEATLSGTEKKELLVQRERLVEGLLNKQDTFWVPIRHNLTDEQKKEIEQMSFEGLGFEEESVRYYPEASMAAHLLGFVGSDFSGQQTGYFGLEGYYDLELRGKGGYLLHEKDAVNLPILTGIFSQQEKKDGKDIKLFLNRTVQAIIEDELSEAIEKYGAKSGWVVVMDPKTGAVLAMAADPKYDQDKYTDFPQEVYKNPILSEVYEPGSTFKVLVMSAAINEGVVKPQTKCNICGEPYKIDKYTIKTWNDEYVANRTMNEVIQHSDNIGMVFVGQKLGIDKFLKYLDKFGFREKTGIDLQEEISSSIKPDSQWNNVDLATASFGQGMAVTGMQMIRAVSVIANGGKLIEPHLVSQMIGSDKTLQVKPKEIRQVIMPEVARQVTEMMVNAVDQGEAKWAKPEGYKIAGKTGTAQIPVAGHYDREKTIASFIGFAPANDPKFIMLTYLREPASSPWGSETAAPLFFSIAKKILVYYGIPPEE